MINLKQKVLINLCTNINLFKHLKLKYTNLQIKDVNNLIRTRFKLFSLQSNNAFLNKCILRKVVPKFILKRINKSKLNHSITVERTFMSSDILLNQQLIEKTRKYYNNLLGTIRSWISFTDLIRILKYSTIKTHAVRKSTLIKNDKLIMLLHKNRFGSMLPPSSDNILNLSQHVLTEDQRFVLSHGINFNVPPKSLNREEVLAEFEVLAGQLKHQTPRSADEVSKLKTKLADLALGYSSTPIENFNIRRDFFKILRSLKELDDIVITRPDKGAGTVILDKKDYLSKMKEILNDNSKFRFLGPVQTHDHTEKIENKLRRLLSKLLKNDFITKTEYELIRPGGSLRPRLYGLPKTHKPNIPLRPILSMVGSAQHKLAQWLTQLLTPVVNK